MNTTIDTLTRFNRQVLQCQDEVYTLAWYLLGDSTLAEAAVQTAVIAAYRCYAARGGNVRRLILKAILRQRRQSAHQPIPATGWLQSAGQEDAQIATLLHSLPEPERQALVLIDILGLSYAEASAIAAMPVEVLRHHLAQALRKIGAASPVAG